MLVFHLKKKRIRLLTNVQVFKIVGNFLIRRLVRVVVRRLVRRLLVVILVRRLVRGFLVGRSGVRFVSTFVGDISDVTGIIIDVIVDDLLATIGKVDPVAALGVVIVTILLLAHVSVVVVVLNVPAELVVRRSL